MQNGNRRWKRRNYLINKDLQGKYTFYFFMIVTIGSILFTLIFSLLAQDTLTIVYKNSNLQLGKTPQMLITELLKAHWIFILLSGVIVSLVAIFLTHRFAGPIYRFEKSVDEMNHGNFNFEIILRRHDAGKELAKMMNTFTATTSRKIIKLRECSGIIDSNLSLLSQSIPRDNKETGKALSAIQTAGAQIKDLLGAFTVKDTIRHAPDPGYPSMPAAALTVSEGDGNFINILMQVKELTADLEEALGSPGLEHLVNDIDAHLEKFSHVMPAADKKILSEAATIVRQTKDVEERLREIVNSYSKIQ